CCMRGGNSIFRCLQRRSDLAGGCAAFWAKRYQRLLRLRLLAPSIALLLAGCSKPSVGTRIAPNGPVEVGIPEHGAYTGAFMDFGDAEDDVSLETIEDFEEMVGKHQAIIASSS